MKKVFLTVFSVMFMLFAVVGIGGITASAQEGEQPKNYLKVGVTLTEDITFNFNVVGANDYATAKMHFAYLNGKEKTGETTLENGNGTIKFSELPAQYMAEDVTVTLTLVKADGTEDVQKAQTVSLRSYARTVLNESTDSAKDKALKKLVIDMLYYGDAAQSYLAKGAVADSDKATAVLTDSEKNAYALAKKAEKSDYALENNTSADMRWVRYGAKFDSRLGVFFEFVAKNSENLSVKFNDGTTVTTFETRTESVNGVETTVYKAIKYLSVLDYTSPVTARLYSGTDPIGSPITYSVNSLTYDFGEATKDYALAIAATTYASSAVDYKNGVGYYYFEAVDERVYVSGNAIKSSEHCIAMNENCKGSVIAFPICSSKATNADLYFNIASRSTSAKIADILKIKVNGAEVFTDADLPTEGREWFTYNDVFLSNISLKSGINEITFEVLTNNQSINTNLRSIIFKNCDAQLDWADSPVSNFVLKIEAEDTILGQPSHGYPSVKGGENASNDKYLGGVGEAGYLTPGEATITFKVNASEEETVRLYFGAGVAGSARASAFAITVNGEPYSSELSWSGGGWCDWKARYWGAIKLKKGENVIVIRINEGCQINIDYFRIESMSKIDFVKE